MSYEGIGLITAPPSILHIFIAVAAPTPPAWFCFFFASFVFLRGDDWILNAEVFSCALY